MTSTHGGENVGRIAADANVILSAVIGKAALRVFSRSDLQVVSTVATLDEVREYIPALAASYGIGPEILEGQLRLLSIQEYTTEAFEDCVPKATRLIGDRDPDDVPLLALALALAIPVWTNDRDFEQTGIECYTTAKLLRQLGI